jgi:hypothetical protein
MKPVAKTRAERVLSLEVELNGIEVAMGCALAVVEFDALEERRAVILGELKLLRSD